ncbi:hypothetical protein EV697_102411 [Bisgaardia hudsonensis]|uniref:Uncharacterized protein n=1 Tax=Bisgaardia hudsonensis TaxID=109472 RepID=A0A4R2N1U5_9PAST|nr:hypothetical protein [Bisgaardia hudsonensis]QLB12917.1 hypothetical protein A6A11_04495 [Bisgaardia hudsonensis]TCP13524.1 hypothetical protein EV697_102411 [Bisgaardia hudsonensis]
MDELSIKIVMLLFPGIITTMFLDKFTEHKPWGNYVYSLFIIFYGILAYFNLQLIQFIYQFLHVGADNWKDYQVILLASWKFVYNVSQNNEIPYSEIMWAAVVALGNAMIFCRLEKTEVLSRFLQRCGITDKYGSYSTFVLMSKKYEGEYIDAIFYNQNLMYRGIIESINEKENEYELIFMDVTLYRIDDSGNPKPISEMDHVCLACSYKDLILQSPNKSYSNQMVGI